MVKAQISELINEKGKLEKEFKNLLSEREEIVSKADSNMRETKDSPEYVEVIKERNSKVEEIDDRLTKINLRIKAIKNVISETRSKVEVSEGKE